MGLMIVALLRTKAINRSRLADCRRLVDCTLAMRHGFTFDELSKIVQACQISPRGCRLSLTESSI
jgi:hypothetical protein